jgi:membrane protease YdiL (CAAX protease family)
LHLSRAGGIVRLMPSASESLILLYVLAAVFLSLPVAIVLRPRNRESEALGSELPPLMPASVPLPPGAPPLPGWHSYYTPPGADLYVPQARARTWERPDAWFAFGLAVIVALLMGPVSSFLISHREGSEAPEMQFTAALFVTQIVFQAGFVGIIVAWIVAVRRFSLVERLGLRARGWLLTPALALLWLIIAYFVLVPVSLGSQVFMEKITGMELKAQGLVESAPDITDNATRVLMLITLCLGAPLMEELLFRGVLYSIAARWLHPWYACLASSVLFGVIHGNLLSLIPLTVLGMFLAEAYRRTRTLAVPVLMHAMFNLISYLALFYGPPELRQ